MPRNPRSHSSRHRTARRASFGFSIRCIRYVALLLLVASVLVPVTTIFPDAAVWSILRIPTSAWQLHFQTAAPNYLLPELLVPLKEDGGARSTSSGQQETTSRPTDVDTPPPRKASATLPVQTKPKKKENEHDNLNADNKPMLQPQETPIPTNSGKIPAYQRRRLRFPSYGTPEYAAVCPWVTVSSAHDPNHQTDQKDVNCTFLVRPPPNSNEGVSAWVADVVAGHLQVSQTSCRFKIDYGANDMDLASIVVPPQKEQYLDWTTPHNFTCDPTHHCYTNQEGVAKWEKEQQQQQPLAKVPQYRRAYKNRKASIRMRQRHYHVEISYDELSQRLTGFQKPLGFACSMAALFHLSPNANQYEPQLYTDLLPLLRDPESLVISLYVREGFTDRQSAQEAKAQQQKNDGTLSSSAIKKDIQIREPRAPFEKSARGPVDCALALEREFLTAAHNSSSSNSSNGRIPQQIVWLVISDSNDIKELIQSKHGGKSVPVPEPVPPIGGSNGIAIQRKVVYTSSRGRHSKPKQSPKTADLADAFIDWYLIAESDAVVTSDGVYSFGLTAGLRTARPIYTENPHRSPSCGRTKVFDCFCRPTYDAIETMEGLLANTSNNA